MTASKQSSPRSLGVLTKNKLEKVAAHIIQPEEYDELPELTDDMVARGTVNKGGRPRAENPRKLISIRLPEDVILKWRATGPGWQTRMAEKLARVVPK